VPGSDLPRPTSGGGAVRQAADRILARPEFDDDRRPLLERARDWVAPGGLALATVPNAHSLHRQAAVLMGLLPVENALNDTDRHYGHRRVYDLAGLRADFAAAGWTVTRTGGYWLKPVSNAQTAEHWTPEMLDAYLRLGERYPESAAEIYVVAEP